MPLLISKKHLTGYGTKHYGTQRINIFWTAYHRKLA